MHAPQQQSSRMNNNPNRQVLHGNAKNKRGIVAADFSRPSKHRGYRIRGSQGSPVGHGSHDGFSPAPHRAYGDTIVKGKPPKKEIVFSRETRFTIPSSPTNANILNQTVFRCLETHEDLLNELKSFHKVHSFATDQEHEIEILL